MLLLLGLLSQLCSMTAPPPTSSIAKRDLLAPLLLCCLPLTAAFSFFFKNSPSSIIFSLSDNFFVFFLFFKGCQTLPSRPGGISHCSRHLAWWSDGSASFDMILPACVSPTSCDFFKVSLPLNNIFFHTVAENNLNSRPNSPIKTLLMYLLPNA